MERNAEKIWESLRECPVIDTHEHLENEERQPDCNVLSEYTRHYFICDLISSGMDPAIHVMLDAPDRTIKEKWDLLEPYWEYCRATGYGRMLDEAVRVLYGVPELNRDTVEDVEKGFRALRAKPGYGERILRETCNIRHCMDNIWHLRGDDRGGLFWFMTQIDGWVLFDNAAVEGMTDIDEWVALCLKTLAEDFSLRNAKGLKMAIAYRRSLTFEKTTHTKAQADFAALGRGETPGVAAQDYVLHAILAWANERGLIFQIHTGYQESNGNVLGNTDPLRLNNLLGMYPRVRFDLFHMGYPFQAISGALGKMYPNVRLDMCWAHILAPATARRTLREWLSSVPCNKIFAFGGDCLSYDVTVGHLALARQNVAWALSDCIEDGLFSAARAEQVAHMLFYDNPKAFYGMD